MAVRTEPVPLSSWREEGDDWHYQSAGPACWPLGQARLHSDGLHREVSAGGFSSFLSILFSVICFDLVSNTKSFYFIL